MDYTLIAGITAGVTGLLNLAGVAFVAILAARMRRSATSAGQFALTAGRSESAAVRHTELAAEHAAAAELAAKLAVDMAERLGLELAARLMGPRRPADLAGLLASPALRTTSELPCLPCTDKTHGFPGTHCDNHRTDITPLAGCPYGKPKEQDEAPTAGSTGA
jgi:hypothetical protein